MPLVQRLFSFENFSLFLGKDLEILKFFFEFFLKKYIHEQKVHQILHGFLEFKETWNKLTNFKLNHDVANQMRSEAKLGHLLFFGP